MAAEGSLHNELCIYARLEFRNYLLGFRVYTTNFENVHGEIKLLKSGNHDGVSCKPELNPDVQREAE